MSILPKEVLEATLEIYRSVFSGKDYERIENFLTSHEWEVENFDGRTYWTTCSKCKKFLYFNIYVTKDSYKHYCDRCGTEDSLSYFNDNLTCEEMVIRDIIE